MYLTEKEINNALNLGFKVTQCPNKGVSATRGTRRIWQVYDTSHGQIKPQWQTADLLGDMFKHHQKFDSFADALQRHNFCSITDKED